PTTAIHTLSLHDALPILLNNSDDNNISPPSLAASSSSTICWSCADTQVLIAHNIMIHLILILYYLILTKRLLIQILFHLFQPFQDRKSTRLNSSHVKISY